MREKVVDIHYHQKFVKDFKKLPRKIRELVVELEKIFRTNPFDPQLHTKKLSGKLQCFYSFRTTRDWRIILEFTEKDLVTFLAVMNRKDIYR